MKYDFKSHLHTSKQKILVDGILISTPALNRFFSSSSETVGTILVSIHSVVLNDTASKREIKYLGVLIFRLSL